MSRECPSNCHGNISVPVRGCIQSIQAVSPTLENIVFFYLFSGNLFKEAWQATFISRTICRGSPIQAVLVPGTLYLEALDGQKYNTQAEPQA
jgi:hypothetical protein